MSEPLRILASPVRLSYTLSAGQALTRFLRPLVYARIIGQRCPRCRKVFVPPRGSCPTCGVATSEEVPVADTGTVTTFAVINIPFEGRAQELALPYVCAYILLDGADVPILHLIQEIPVAEVRMGLRVQAVWAPIEQRTPSLTSIRHFRPSAEPDAPFEAYKEHL
jgi:uncharacterized OB-fold protein